MREFLLTRRALAYLRSLKAQGELIFYVKLHGSPMQRAGLPDLLILYWGRTFAVELKGTGGKLTTLQEHTLDEMREAGATTGVVRSVDELEELLACHSSNDDL